MIDLEQLDAFVTFAEHMSFTHAARARHLSQPAIFGQVRKLSEALGLELYKKRGRELALTADGERVLAFGREMRARVTGFLDEAHHRAPESAVALAAGAGAYLYLLGPAIRAFLARGRRRLRLLTRDRDGTFDAVSSGEAQLGVTPADALPHGLTSELLCEVGQALAVPSAHSIAKRDSVRVRELRGASLIVPPSGQPHRAMIAGAFADANIPWSVAVEADGWELMLRFVELGVGLAIVNACCRPPHGVVLRPLPELPALRYMLIRRTGGHLEGACAELAASLRRHASDGS